MHRQVLVTVERLGGGWGVNDHGPGHQLTPTAGIVWHTQCRLDAAWRGSQDQSLHHWVPQFLHQDRGTGAHLVDWLLRALSELVYVKCPESV